MKARKAVLSIPNALLLASVVLTLCSSCKPLREDQKKAIENGLAKGLLRPVEIFGDQGRPHVWVAGAIGHSLEVAELKALKVEARLDDGRELKTDIEKHPADESIYGPYVVFHVRAEDAKGTIALKVLLSYKGRDYDLNVLFESVAADDKPAWRVTSADLVRR